MHMADALLSPGVGGVMWAATAAVTVYSGRKVQSQLDNSKIPLMGVLGAFVFAAQMINFAIPATGSSGHLGGGLLLAILLGPHAAFLTLASVLTVQALFFADGGLLALGSNIFNLGFFPCFICYTFIYKKIISRNSNSKRLAAACIIAAIAGLQLGAFAVVMQTVLSGITSLPFSSFLMVMQPIHLAIGFVEGIATAGVVSFIWKNRPEILEHTLHEQPLGNLRIGNIIISLIAATALMGGIVAWYASERPDGLEWSIEKVAGSSELENKDQVIHDKLARFQNNTSILPDYSFRKDTLEPADGHTVFSSRTGTSLAGIIGGLAVLALSFIIGLTLKKKNTQPGKSCL